MRNWGVYSEVGTLRTVLVRRPGLAHQRLTSGNCQELLFDDVLWVHEAQTDHNEFRPELRDRSPWLDEMPAQKLAAHLIGGIAARADRRGVAVRASGPLRRRARISR
jgi:arginine deiminase